MQFANIELTWLFILIPFVAIISGVRFIKRRKALANLADELLLPQLIPGFSKEKSGNIAYAFFVISAACFIIIAMLRPQWGFVWEEQKRSGVDIVVTIDVSESMLATDIAPNRLERARREIIDLLENFRGDRIALVAFSRA